MKNHTSLLLFGLLLLIVPLTARSNRSAWPNAFSLDSMGISASPLPHVGDTVQLTVLLTANVTGLATLQLHFPGSVAPPNQGSGETIRDSTISVDSGSSYSFTIPMKLFNLGGSLLEAAVFPITHIPGITNSVGKSLDIELSPMAFSVSDMFSTMHDSATVSIDEPLYVGYPLSISGKVQYIDLNQHSDTLGAYGVFVILVFHKPTGGAGSGGQLGGFTNFFHPISGCLPNVHYCKVAADGSYSFNFIGPLWTTYSDVTLFVTKNNDATMIMSGPFYTISTIGGGCSPQTTFHDNYETIPITSPYSISFTQDIMVPSDEGAVLRNMEFSREFDSVRPIGVIPPMINTYLKPSILGGEADGIFNPWALEIDIESDHTAPDNVAHEWGHYAHYTLSDDGFESTLVIDNPSPYLEGFAEFHQFAVRNYIAANYDDYIDWAMDNLEESPFETNPGRFFSLSYNSEPFSRFSCFLWNVYDGYSDPGFKAPPYTGTILAGADNDDVEEPLLIFSQIASHTGYTTWRGFESDIESEVSSAEASSMVFIDTNMSFDNIYYVPVLMRPAQLEGVELDIIDGDIADLRWAYQNYDPSDPFANLPTGVELYQSDGDGGWYLLGTTPYTSIPTLDLTYWMGETYNPDLPLVFKASTYNSSGDAYNPPVFDDAMKIADGHSSIDTSGITVTVHPNPSSLTTRICVEDLPEGEPATVEIVDVMGQHVTTLYNATPEAELGLCLSLDCSRMPSGTYYARVVNDIMGTTVKFSVEH